MAAKKIITDTIFLQQKSKTATRDDLKAAIDLKDTLIAQKEAAAGLAANMIGINKQIITFYFGSLPIVMLNPKIILASKKYSTKEGCLSLTGLRKTDRYQIITVEYQNINFEKQRQNFTGYVAQVIQHEVDHCHGRLI
ncbi:peptide deformylase [Lactobacillus sp. ESL0681]|uniref:peptide deformylase n=1 Tax=Lactobacillus sp. ESL0681 TaxID=2983211 RepID=UPI0023F6BF9F|nr:peptide deformylase [Lactobacillus sp. ESL0681]WEV39761.1 peptide deformylase [Lactobacillus sp. ESL0681]